MEPYQNKGAGSRIEYCKRAGGAVCSQAGKEGYVCGSDTVWQREFEEMFPYEETDDQLMAIEDTKKDMDRLRSWIALYVAM